MVLLILNTLILQEKIFLLMEWVCFVKDGYTWALSQLLEVTVMVTLTAK
jgi:hypothetical protein